MTKTYFFVVILGEIDNAKFKKEEERLKTLGTVEKLTERTYGLVIKSERKPDRKDLREKISGEEKYLSLIIGITSRTDCSWCLYKTRSRFLTEILQTLYNEMEEEQHGE